MPPEPRSSTQSRRGQHQWTWPQVWQYRLQRQRLLQPALPEYMLEVVANVCGIHAQVAASAELSLGLRVEGITRADVKAALWQQRTLVKTYGLRGTLHLFATRELPLWLAALRAKVPPHAPSAAEREAVPADRRQSMLEAIRDAVAGRALTRDELHAEIERRLGEWATAATFPAFGGQWPRWQIALRQAAIEGLIVFGANRGNRVTYVSTEDWVGPLPSADGEAALREVCRRFLMAYGPATHYEFARWFTTTPKAALELMRSLDLEEVSVDGWRGWLPREALDAQPEEPPRASVLLMPHYDCYVVGGFPRGQLIPEHAPAALRNGTAAPFAVVLIDGVVGGLWERRLRGKRLEVRVDAFKPLSSQQRAQVERAAARIGEIQELVAEVSYGPVAVRAHL